MTTLPESLTQLTRALDALNDALTSGQPDAVLSAEAPLARALSAVAARMSEVGGVDRDRLRALVHDARVALFRCRHLGRAADEYARVLLASPAYGAAGPVVSAPSRAFDSRV